jgi:hypothetical protein
MTVREIYQEAISNDHNSLQMLIRFLVYEKKVICFEDSQEKIEYYLQEKFSKKMNEYLYQFSVKERVKT